MASGLRPLATLKSCLSCILVEHLQTPIIGPPSMKVKEMENFLNKRARRDANSLIWMPQAEAMKTPCLFHFWGWANSLFPLFALWGNKNWPPCMNVKKMEIFWNKRGYKGCKWSDLNTPGTENPLSHPLLELDKFSFPIIGPHG